MTIKEAFASYFERFKQADKRFRSLALHWDPLKQAAELERFQMAPQLIDLSSRYSEGAIDYVTWQPVPKEIAYDFSPLETAWQITIPKAVKDYFNTYWFLDFGTWSGDETCEFFTDVDCHIIPVVPWEDLSAFCSQYESLRQELTDIGQEAIQAVPIGHFVYGQLFVGCQDEKVYAIHLDRGTCYTLAKNLPSFIANMKVPGVDSALLSM